MTLPPGRFPPASPKRCAGASPSRPTPLEKPGIVGAFCRAYTIEEAIEAFLTDVYEPSAMNGRYDYIPADLRRSVVVYDGKFAYSHHATDPVCGKLLNAFDLVRLHKFRELDENVGWTPRRASYLFQGHGRLRPGGR